MSNSSSTKLCFDSDDHSNSTHTLEHLSEDESQGLQCLQFSQRLQDVVYTGERSSCQQHLQNVMRTTPASGYSLLPPNRRDISQPYPQSETIASPGTAWGPERCNDHDVLQEDLMNGSKHTDSSPELAKKAAKKRRVSRASASLKAFNRGFGSHGAPRQGSKHKLTEKPGHSSTGRSSKDDRQKSRPRALMRYQGSVGREQDKDRIN